MRRHALARQAPGQATVEFALAFLAFLALIFGVIDTSRAVFSLHGLSRAAESIAHQVALKYETVGASYYLTSGDAVSMLQSAHTAGDVSFSTAEPTTIVNPSGGDYQEMHNGSVYICAVPYFSAPSSPPAGFNGPSGPQLIQVTVVGSFEPASTLFVGGRTMSLSESATALTYLGEESGYSFTNTCPSH